MNSPLKLIGVNFHGYGSAAYQNRHNANPPRNYVDDSMKIFSSNGITCIRVPVHWESWEFNKDHFHNDLIEIADAADKHGIMCIYDNHQWECASWIGSGIGFPNSLMSQRYERTNRPTSKPEYNLKRDFWGRWWNRELETVDGVDCWKA